MIGCGAIAEEHLRCISQLENIEAVVFCDTDIARARLMLDQYGGAYATDDVARVFDDSRITAVYICTFHDTHAPLAIRACRAGKHIMMEKPLALTIDECLAIGEAVESSGVTMMTAFKLRYYPLVRRAREFIPQPTVTIAQMMDARWPDDFWAQHPVMGGGNVLSQGCHTMDLIYYLNRSEPVSIFAEGGTYTHQRTTVIDNIAAVIRFANGRVASVAQGDSGQTPFLSKFSFQIIGEGKSVHLHDRLRTGTFFDGERTEVIHDAEERGMMEENREFRDALLAGRPPHTTYIDGLRATTMALKAFESIRTRTRQEIVLQPIKHE